MQFLNLLIRNIHKKFRILLVAVK